MKIYPCKNNQKQKKTIDNTPHQINYLVMWRGQNNLESETPTNRNGQKTGSNKMRVD